MALGRVQPGSSPQGQSGRRSERRCGERAPSGGGEPALGTPGSHGAPDPGPGSSLLTPVVSRVLTGTHGLEATEP